MNENDNLYHHRDVVYDDSGDDSKQYVQYNNHRVKKHEQLVNTLNRMNDSYMVIIERSILVLMILVTVILHVVRGELEIAYRMVLAIGLVLLFVNMIQEVHTSLLTYAGGVWFFWILQNFLIYLLNVIIFDSNRIISVNSERLPDIGGNSNNSQQPAAAAVFKSVNIHLNSGTQDELALQLLNDYFIIYFMVTMVQIIPIIILEAHISMAQYRSGWKLKLISLGVALCNIYNVTSDNLFLQVHTIVIRMVCFTIVYALHSWRCRMKYPFYNNMILVSSRDASRHTTNTNATNIMHIVLQYTLFTHLIVMIMFTIVYSIFLGYTGYTHRTHMTQPGDNNNNNNNDSKMEVIHDIQSTTGEQENNHTEQPQHYSPAPPRKVQSYKPAPAQSFLEINNPDIQSSDEDSEDVSESRQYAISHRQQQQQQQQVDHV